MGVYIKGMEMPTNCDSCLFDDGVHCMAYPPSEDMVYDIADGKPNWCPLVPVPDHGRLIDADALIDHLEFATKHCAIEGHTAQRYSEMIVELSIAPTIIPESEEGE